MASHRATFSLLTASCLALAHFFACSSAGPETTNSTSGSGGDGGSSSSSSTSSGGGGAGGGGTCPITGLCDTLTLSDVNSACGLAATDTKPMGAATPGAEVSSCAYLDGSDTIVSAGKGCLHGLDPQMFYQDQHDTMLAATETQEDLTGVGSKAYFRSDTTQHIAEVTALSGSVIASVTSYQATDIAASKACLIALVKQVLASP